MTKYALKATWPVLALLMMYGCSTLRRPAAPVPVTTESGLIITVTRQGSGSPVQSGDLVRFHYRAQLEDGTIFDDSRERGDAATVRVGNSQLIPGLTEGISRLGAGDRATLVIPPALAYGTQGYGPVPPDARLTYHVEILEIVPAGEGAGIDDLPRERTESGLEYVVLEGGAGLPLEAGMEIKVHYTGYFEDGTVFDTSRQRGEPFVFTLGRRMVIPGWEEAFSYLRAGDKARLFIPYALAYGQEGRGRIPGRSNLVFDVEVIEARRPVRPVPFETANIRPVVTDSGLQLFIMDAGTGALPVNGHVITLHYSGYLGDGTLFDSSVQRGEPFRFVLGSGQVIPGWDEGIALLKRGSKARIVIPPQLAYGSRGRGPIPPDATLYFDVEIISIDSSFQ